MAKPKLVTCRICKTQIDKNLAFKYGDKQYCCSEEEYLQKLEFDRISKENQEKSKEARKNTIDIINKIFEYEITNSLLFKELKELSDVYTYDNIYSYINDNFDLLKRTLDSKKFSSEHGKIKYFTTIIRNNIVDYLTISKDEKEEKEYIKYVEYDVPEMKYKSKNRRRSLYEIEMELAAEDE